MYRSLSRFILLALITMALLMLVGMAAAAPAAPAGAVGAVWDQDFSLDYAGWFDSNNGGDGNIAVAGGTALFTSDVGGAPFSRFDGYRDVWPGTWTAEIDVYLDPSWPTGQGFDYSVAANGSDNNHQRDFIFHVGVVEDYGTVVGKKLLVNASNNADFYTNPYKLVNDNGGSYFVVTSAGWYTLQHVFRDDGGALAVDFNLVDSGGTTLWTATKSSAADAIPAEVGGNRYSWFTHIDVAAGIEVDNHQLFMEIASVDPIGDQLVCDSGTVEIVIDDVANLYGYEMVVEYNKDLVSASGNFENDWIDPSGNGFPGPAGWQAECDDGLGQCKFAYTRGNQDGEIATTEPQVIASIDFTSILPSVPTSFDVTVNDIKLSDKDSFEVPGATSGPLAVEVCGNATVSGQIGLQGRPQPSSPFSGPPSVFEVNLTGPYGTFTATPDPANGMYTVSGVKFTSSGTDYDIEADHSVYLKATKVLNVASATVEDQDTTLLGGDATDNGKVGSGDLACVGGLYGLPGPYQCGGGDPTTADLNNDGVVNIQDLVLVAGNYSLMETQGW